MPEAANKVARQGRPQFRNIHVLQIINYRMPLSAIVSILHRISGFVLFLLLPVILYFVDKSLTSPETFESFRRTITFWPVKLIGLGLAWAYLHHFFAGIRHLVMDCHISLDKDSARKSAVAVLVLSLLFTALVAFKFFGRM